MSQDFIRYFEDELTRLREDGRAFAQRHPKIANRLQLGDDRAPDPDVERLIQAFAFQTARLHQRLDAGFAELADPVLDGLFPLLARRAPARLIACVEPRADGAPLERVLHWPRGLECVSRQVDDPAELRGFVCRFRTAYAADIAPLRIERARVDLGAGVGADTPGLEGDGRLRLWIKPTPGASVSRLGLDRLRVFIQADAKLALGVYEAVLGRSTGAIARRDPEGRDAWRRVDIQPVGFDPEHSLFGDDERVAKGPRLMVEHIAMPEKFLFFDINGLAPVLEASAGEEDGGGFEIALGLDLRRRAELAALLRAGVDADTFALNCVPLVNLFEHKVEPIRLDHTRARYPLVPDRRRPWGYEIWRVTSARLTERGPQGRAERVAAPLYGAWRAPQTQTAPLFWSVSRIDAPDGGHDHAISLLDERLHADSPTDGVLSVDALCSNRDFPTLLPAAPQRGDFTPAQDAERVRIRRLGPPAAPMSFGDRGPRAWRLISQMRGGRLSFADGGAAGLREALSAFAPADTARDRLSLQTYHAQLASLVTAEARRSVGRVGAAGRDGALLGSAFDIGFDPTPLSGFSPYLFAAVLDRFLAAHAGVNSFTQMRAVDARTQQEIGQWPKRLGVIETV
ncbi:MAG: type VI secretion system baseplate subunit TssF [Maricaulaceae bacterium]